MEYCFEEFDQQEVTLHTYRHSRNGLCICSITLTPCRPEDYSHHYTISLDTNTKHIAEGEHLCARVFTTTLSVYIYYIESPTEILD